MSQEKEPIYDETGRKVYSGKAILPAKNVPFYQESEHSQQSGAADESASKKETALPLQKKKRRKRGGKGLQKKLKGKELRMAKTEKNVEVVPLDAPSKPAGAAGVLQVEKKLNKEENNSDKDTEGEAAEIGQDKSGKKDSAKETIVEQIVDNVSMQTDASVEKEDKDKKKENKQTEMGGTEVGAAQVESGEKDTIQNESQQVTELVGQDGMNETEKDKKNIETDTVQGEATQSIQSVGKDEKEKIMVTEDEPVQQHEVVAILDNETEEQNKTIQDSKEAETDEKNRDDNRKRSADYQDPEPEGIPEGKKSKTEESLQEQVETPQDNKTMDFQEPVEVLKPCVEKKLDLDKI